MERVQMEAHKVRIDVGDGKPREIVLSPLPIQDDDPRPPDVIFDEVVTPAAVVKELESHPSTADLVRQDPGRAKEVARMAIAKVKKMFLKTTKMYEKWSHFNRKGFTAAVPVVYAAYGMVIQLLALLLRFSSPVTSRIIGYAIKALPLLLLCDPATKFDMRGFDPAEVEKWAHVAYGAPLLSFRYREEPGWRKHIGTLSPYFGENGVGDGHTIPVIDYLAILTAGVQDLHKQVLDLRRQYTDLCARLPDGGACPRQSA